MALNRDIADRSYLYGRLLALAERAEGSTYTAADGGRTTNAKRYWSAFTRKPASTWIIINDKLIPYLEKMKPGLKHWYEYQIAEVFSKFGDSDVADEPLNERYLHGYYCQLQDLYTKKNKEVNQDESNK